MSNYYHLDVYKSSYRLLVEIYRNLKNLSKEYKYTIGEKVKDKAFEILINIYKANKSKDKILYLDNALDNTEFIRLSLRLLRDLNVLNDNKFISLNEIIEDVFLQFKKWKNYEFSEKSF
jgi:hypothetical protein